MAFKWLDNSLLEGDPSYTVRYSLSFKTVSLMLYRYEINGKLLAA